MTIQGFPVNDSQGEWQTTLHRFVQTYLVHHGYCSSAEAFAKSTNQAFVEEIKSIKNRQRILKLVLAGRIGEATETTHKLYPGLLERNPNLLFLLKCRQFIEMVNGTDSEVRPARSPRSQGSSPARSPSYSSRTAHASVLKYSSNSPTSASPTSQVICGKPTVHVDCSSHKNTRRSPVEDKNITNNALSNGNVLNGNKEIDTSENICDDIDVRKGETVTVEYAKNGRTLPMITNGNTQSSIDFYQNSNTQENDSEEDENEMDVDPPRRLMCGGSQLALERMLQFGRELHSFSVQLKREFGTNETNKKMLQDAFSLLAYSDPWNSPVGHQMDPVQREPVCAALNSTILESHNLPRQPPLELALAHAQEVVKLMSRSGLGSCAFANLEDTLLH
ncbi:ran-binding protein 9-like isoform X2 [Limulus polyphemus]|uniref:Ran-binding protein 9-like isoform X2 n=1 Tax=Limulus polyphemus TaxID=6850 RepID=A0ABM1BWB7_LIMPO|nr:ran-binding protein 9-like isoform X2 [Limulus polyphemus]